MNFLLYLYILILFNLTKGKTMKRIMVLLAVSALSAGTAGALLPYMDTDELVSRSELVVYGEVLSIESFEVADGAIYSRATVVVDDFLVGTYDDTVVEVIYPGGIVGDVGMMTSISPHFETGEEIVLFLFTNDNGELVLTNYAGGKYTVDAGKVIEKDISLNEFVNTIDKANK